MEEKKKCKSISDDQCNETIDKFTECIKEETLEQKIEVYVKYFELQEDLGLTIKTYNEMLEINERLSDLEAKCITNLSVLKEIFKSIVSV